MPATTPARGKAAPCCLHLAPQIEAPVLRFDVRPRNSRTPPSNTYLPHEDINRLSASPFPHTRQQEHSTAAESPSVPIQATAVAGPSRPPTHVLETHNSVPETDGALAPSPQPARSKARRPRTPQHTNAANGSATSSDRHTNGHGSVGAYNTAPTSPTTRRPPGPVRGGDRARLGSPL